MTTISARDLAGPVAELVRLVQQSGEVEIVDAAGRVIARIIPGEAPANMLAPSNEEPDELDRLIAAIAPYVPADVDAVQIVRDIRD
jgi:antitoxin (DNA-binding transcriptional repressor) of toxin-antitoxin stability system